MKFQYELSPDTKEVWNRVPSVITTMITQMSVVALAFFIYTKFLSDSGKMREFYDLHEKMYTPGHALSIAGSLVILLGFIALLQRINDRAVKRSNWVDSMAEQVLEEIPKTFMLFGVIFVLAGLKLTRDQILLEQYFSAVASLLAFSILPTIGCSVLIAGYEYLVLRKLEKQKGTQESN